MTLGLYLYKTLTFLMAPFMGAFFRRRAKSGKEARGRITERLARKLPNRPEGALVWLHAASVGESQLLLELVKRLSETSSEPATYLLTCQTQTAARMVTAALVEDDALRGVSAIQQMAPVDSPSGAKRFVEHWQPNAGIFAEGDIWPNLLLQLKKRDIPAALINARMTEKSINGWRRWSKTARRVIGSFDCIVAADLQTKTGLEHLSGKPVSCPGNLKSALPVPSVDPSTLETLQSIIGDKQVLLAASTHAGEEALALDAFMSLPKGHFLIVAPRHPERGDEVDALLSCTKLAISRRSEDDPITEHTDVLLADTMGEMGLWYRLADTVYLGGGHAPGVGGHNPIEALRLRRPVISGPSVFNFKDVTERLLDHDGFSIVKDAVDLAANIPAPAVSDDLIRMLEGDAIGPMQATMNCLRPMLAKAGVGI